MEPFILIILYTLSVLFLVYKLYQGVRKDGISPPFGECCWHALIILLPINMFVAALVLGWEVEAWWKKRKKFKGEM